MSATTGDHRGGLGRRIWKSRRLYLYIAPTLLLLLTFSYYPALSALYHAFFKWEPVGQSEYIGLGNFRRLYLDLFTPLPALEGAAEVWAWVQQAGWTAAGLAAAFFVLMEAARERGWKFLQPAALVLTAVGAGVVTASLAVGLARTSVLIEGALLRHLLIGHVGLLALLGGQVLAWRQWRTTRQGRWWHLLALATVLAVLFGIGLVMSFSHGDPARTNGVLRTSIGNLGRIMGFHLSVGLAMPLLIAEILFHLRSERWKYLYRVLFIIPMVVPGIVGLLMWQIIYNPSQEWGILNRLLAALRQPPLQLTLATVLWVLALYLSVLSVLARKLRGAPCALLAAVAIMLLAAPLLLGLGYGGYRAMAGPGAALPMGEFFARYSGVGFIVEHLNLSPQNWLGDPKIALRSLMMMGFPWVGTVSMLIFYAGLQAIPESVLESARLDGATGLRRFFTIDFPMILGQFKLLLILGVIGGIQGFQSSLILTWGGPGTATEMPGLRMFKEAFNYGVLGFGTTIGVMMFLVILVVTYINMKYIRPSTEEEVR